MKTEIFLAALLLTLPLAIGAQNSSTEESGILSSIPDIEINSASDNLTPTGQNTESLSRLSWMVILVIAFLAVLLYSYDIDPKWIIAPIGVAGIIFLVSKTGLLPV
jgi:hypothetical protein